MLVQAFFDAGKKSEFLFNSENVSGTSHKSTQAQTATMVAANQRKKENIIFGALFCWCKSKELMQFPHLKPYFDLRINEKSSSAFGS
jgi:hypothetical protein